MRWVFVGLLAIHGLVHLLGFAKAFGFAELPQLTQPISRPLGIAWLMAGGAMLVTAVMVVNAPRTWWMLGIAALLLSQCVLFSSWRDAKVGTIANIVVLLGVIYGFAAEGPMSLRTQYRRALSDRQLESSALRPVTEADLAPLPEPVQRYLRNAGVLGQPPVRHYHSSWRGRIRGGPDEAWMEFTADQNNFVHDHSRFFLMHASKAGLPVEVLHTFEGGNAAMTVRLLSLAQIAHASGAELTRAETVTLLNDMCLLAPGALLDPAVHWEESGPDSAQVQFTLGKNTVRAALSFNGSGELTGFVSDDRLRASPDGAAFVTQRWSTPVRNYREFGAHRAFSRGEGRWHEASGEFVYIELELERLDLH